MQASEEFELSSPILPANPPPALTTAKKSKAWMRWAIGLVIAVGLGGGGYFAHSQGYVTIPFLPSAGAALDASINELNKLTAVTSTTTVSLFFEDVPGQKSETNTSNVNSITNGENTNLSLSNGLSLGTSNLAQELTDKLTSARMTVTGTSYSEPGKQFAQGNAESNIVVTVRFDNKDYSGVLNYRKVGLQYFVQLEKVEGFDYGGLKSIVGQWINVELKDAEGLIASETPSAEELGQISAQFSNLVEIARTNKAYVVTKLDNETISGHPTTHSKITLVPEKFEETLTEFIAAEKKEGHDVQKFDSLLDSWKKLNSQPGTKASFQQISLELWIGRQDKLPWKIAARFSFEAPKGILGAGGGKLVYEISNTLTSINQTKTVTAPEKTIKLQDAFSALDSSAYGVDANLFPIQIEFLAPCYVNLHPEIIDQMPKNQVTDQYKTYTDPGATSRLGCEDYTTTQIESAKNSLITDSDGDGLVIAAEARNRTRDDSTDSDLDGTGDYYEFLGTSDPNAGENQSELDSDGDGINDAMEKTLYLSNPQSKDTDGDGLGDDEEIQGWTTKIDPNGVYDSTLFQTKITEPDTDKDGFSDREELCNGYNPNGTGKINTPLTRRPKACP